MKLMIASDIHGAAGFCRALLAACAAEAPDRLLLLGDILYHGPRNDLPEGYDPKQVITLLNPLRDRLLCVRGNLPGGRIDQKNTGGLRLCGGGGFFHPLLHPRHHQ